jgi:acylphosphatase
LKKHLDITVKGKVQGVSFRVGAKAVADQLGVRGFVMNQPNGDVFIAAEADNTMMEMFVEWCHEGAEHAVVTGVETNEGELKNYRNFEVVKKSL